MPSSTYTREISGLSSNGRTLFLRPGKKDCLGSETGEFNLSLFTLKL